MPEGGSDAMAPPLRSIKGHLFNSLIIRGLDVF